MSNMKPLEQKFEELRCRKDYAGTPDVLTSYSAFPY